MPQPAPARFDSLDRRVLAATLLGGLGPILTIGVLIAGYALSARACVGWARPSIWACVALGVLGCAGAAWGLSRPATSPPSAALRLAAIGLQLFCLCVMIGFGVATTTEPVCG